MLNLVLEGKNLSMQEAGTITPLLSLLSSLLSHALFFVHGNEVYREDGKMAVIILFVGLFVWFRSVICNNSARDRKCRVYVTMAQHY